MTTIQIPIRELHARTGHFVRLAATKGEIIVTENGKPTARLLPIVPLPPESPLPTLAQRRRLRADYRAALKNGLLKGAKDSTLSLRETSALRDL